MSGSDADVRMQRSEVKPGDAAGDATAQPMPLSAAPAVPAAQQEAAKHENSATDVASAPAHDADAPAHEVAAGEAGSATSTADLPPSTVTHADVAPAAVETVSVLPPSGIEASAPSSTETAAAQHTLKHMDAMGSGDEVFKLATADALQADGIAVVPQGVQRALDDK